MARGGQDWTGTGWGRDRYEHVCKRAAHVSAHISMHMSMHMRRTAEHSGTYGGDRQSRTFHVHAHPNNAMYMCVCMFLHISLHLSICMYVQVYTQRRRNWMEEARQDMRHDIPRVEACSTWINTALRLCAASDSQCLARVLSSDCQWHIPCTVSVQAATGYSQCTVIVRISILMSMQMSVPRRPSAMQSLRGCRPCAQHCCWPAI